MRKRLIGAAVLIVFAVALVPGTASGQAEKSSLYKRLGGYDAIAAVTDSFITKLATDPEIGKFFVGHSTESKARIRQLVVDQLCAVTGGPCVYIGRAMKQVHAGLGITEAHWTASVKHLVATLDEFKVPKKEQDELLALVSPLKADIVEHAAAK
jgi:hemoglobin